MIDYIPMQDIIKQFLQEIISISNQLHTWFLNLNDQFGISLSDKELHFWIFGLSALVLFYIVRFIFRLLNKLSLSIVAFLFTFIFLLAFAFATEMGQFFSNQGVMDFADVISGIYGFLVFFGIAFSFELFLKLFKHR